MRGSKRLISLTVLLALSGAPAAVAVCPFRSGRPARLDGHQEEAAGRAQAGIPEGVPGLEQGVPKDLYKGSRQQQIDEQKVAAAASAARAPPGSKATKSKGKSAKRRRSCPCRRRRPTPTPRRPRKRTGRRRAAAAEAENRAPPHDLRRHPIRSSRPSPRSNSNPLSRRRCRAEVSRASSFPSHWRGQICA